MDGSDGKREVFEAGEIALLARLVDMSRFTDLEINYRDTAGIASCFGITEEEVVRFRKRMERITARPGRRPAA